MILLIDSFMDIYHMQDIWYHLVGTTSNSCDPTLLVNIHF